MNNPPGKKFPVVIAFQGADTMAEATIMGGGAYSARGMAYLAVDFPGQGGALRLKDLHLPPDTERVVKAMIDYLETRPDVDATRVGMQGISMGGYGVPRAASGEKRIKAAFMSSGSYDLKSDLFEYYPPIQERVRWIIGAKDLADARKQAAHRIAIRGHRQHRTRRQFARGGTVPAILHEVAKAAHRLFRRCEHRHTGLCQGAAVRGATVLTYGAAPKVASSGRRLIARGFCCTSPCAATGILPPPWPLRPSPTTRSGSSPWPSTPPSTAPPIATSPRATTR